MYKVSFLKNSLSILLLMLFSNAQATTLPVTQDTFTNEGRPNTNYGNAPKIRVKQSPENNGYIEFDLSSIVGKAIQSAQLTLKVPKVFSGGDISIRLVNQNWSEDALTYSDQPLLGSEIANSSISTTNSRGEIYIDITDVVKDWVDGTTTNYGLALTTSNANVKFGAKERGIGARLEVSVGDEPAPPTLSGYEIITNSGTYDIPAGGSVGQVVLCPAGKKPLGGGFTLGNPIFSVHRNGPNAGATSTGWHVAFTNNTNTAYTNSFAVFVICATIN